ncbi:MAG: hypothetical protein WD013_00770 [Gemmatimonadota bacterium]
MIEPDDRSRFRTPSDEVEGLLQKALVHAEDGEWDRMAEGLRQTLEDHPGDPYVLCWLGMAERELGMEGIAYERFKRALEAEPEDPVLLATAGNAVAAFDDPAAEAALRTAAMIAPQLPQARWMYGAYLAREGMVEKALDELRAASELDPEDAVIRYEYGVAKALGDDLEGAVFLFAHAAENRPGDGWILLMLGLANLLLGELDDAIGPLEEGARLRPEDVEAQLLSALAFAATGWDERSLEMVERARFLAEGADVGLIGEAEARMEDGAEAARRFLDTTIAPSSFRERLMQRP